MLVDRLEKDGIVECLYKSSNILASVYDRSTRKLIITFNYGGKYSYSDVDSKRYLRFETDESQGVVFSKHIKSHTTEKLDKVDTSELKTKLENLLNETVQGVSQKDT